MRPDRIAALVGALAIATACLSIPPASAQTPTPSPTASGSPTPGASSSPTSTPPASPSPAPTAPSGSPTPAVTPEPMPSGGAPEVSFSVKDGRVRFGSTVALHGRVLDRGAGVAVEIVNETGAVVAAAVTDGAGRFDVTVKPRRNTTFRARAEGGLSEAVRVTVVPRLSVTLREVRLFGRAQASGSIRPAHDGSRVELILRRNGAVAKRLSARIDGRRFKARVPIDLPGTYRLVARFSDADHATARASSRRSRTQLPSLSVGAQGSYVRNLENRLTELGYHLGGADRSFDVRTSDALIAFNKVQGAARFGSVDEATWRRLANPIVPKPRSSSSAFHIEVDQTKQVLYVVKDKKVRRVLHVSTGAGGATHDGSYSVYRKVAGYSPNRLYYPSYFHALRAIHGWPSVPTYAASHGCVRVPMWAAQWIYGYAEISTAIIVYH